MNIKYSVICKALSVEFLRATAPTHRLGEKPFPKAGEDDHKVRQNDLPDLQVPVDKHTPSRKPSIPKGKQRQHKASCAKRPARLLLWADTWRWLQQLTRAIQGSVSSDAEPQTALF